MTATAALLAQFQDCHEQLWYVAHPVHPLPDEIADARRLISRFRVDEVTDRVAAEAVVRANVANAKLWLPWLVRTFPAVSFIMPWVVALDGGGDDDLDPVQRARGLRDCCRTIRACHGMVHVGGRISAGMLEEELHARAVVDLTSLGRVPPATFKGKQ